MYRTTLSRENLKEVSDRILLALNGKKLKHSVRCKIYGDGAEVTHTHLSPDLYSTSTEPVHMHDEGELSGNRYCMRIVFLMGASHHYPGDKVAITDKKVTIIGKLCGKKLVTEFEVV